MRYLLLLALAFPAGCKQMVAHLEVCYEQRLPDENATAKVSLKLDELAKNIR
jgi:hypothetical protein